MRDGFLGTVICEMSHTRAYFPFIVSLVNGWPLWSTSSKGPPTLGFPTPLLASAIFCRLMRSFSCSKYHINPPHVARKTTPAFHEKGCKRQHIFGQLSPISCHMVLCFHTEYGNTGTYTVAVSTLGLLHSLVRSSLGNRLLAWNRGAPECWGSRPQCAAEDTSLTFRKRALECFRRYRVGRHSAGIERPYRRSIGENVEGVSEVFSELSMMMLTAAACGNLQAENQAPISKSATKALRREFAAPRKVDDPTVEPPSQD